MKKRTNDHRYDDIIHLPHHVSATRPRMSALDRAAQFSPFAALTGYESAVRETGRLTEERIELDEDRKTALNEKLQMIKDAVDKQPEITVTYFLPDEKKNGGAYVSVTGRVKKIDDYKRMVVMTDRTAIPIEQIYRIEGELFDCVDFVD